MSRRPPLFKSHTTAVGVGVVLFAAGAFVLWDAYEARGARVPVLLRPFVPF